MKIYTKKGDGGFTALYGGSKVSKADTRLGAYGSCDELNSLLGWALTAIRENNDLAELHSLLQKTQSSLFVIGSRLATDDAELRKKLGHISSADIEELEQAIDKMNESLPELKSFILPGGSEVAARLHMARSFSRRTERTILSFYENCDESDTLIMAYMNRLSDYLFVAARFANHHIGTQDIPWVSQ